MKSLLAHHHAKAAAPAFRQPDADDFHFRAQKFKKHIGGRMKTQSRRDQVDQRRRGLQLHAGEITVTLQITRLLMPADARPIVRRLQWQVQIFGGFQLQNGEAAGSGGAQKVENSVLRGGLRKNLFVHPLGKQRDINAETSC